MADRHRRRIAKCWNAPSAQAPTVFESLETVHGALLENEKRVVSAVRFDLYAEESRTVARVDDLVRDVLQTRWIGVTRFGSRARPEAESAEHGLKASQRAELILLVSRDVDGERFGNRRRWTAGGGKARSTSHVTAQALARLFKTRGRTHLCMT